MRFLWMQLFRTWCFSIHQSGGANKGKKAKKHWSLHTQNCGSPARATTIIEDKGARSHWTKNGSVLPVPSFRSRGRALWHKPRTASKRKRRINHFAKVLSMHTKEGGCMSGTLNHQKPSYVTLSCSFPKGQARRRESSTLCRVEDTLSHLVTASTLSKSWILTA